MKLHGIKTNKQTYIDTRRDKRFNFFKDKTVNVQYNTK